jgi:hypothetical protein
MKFVDRLAGAAALGTALACSCANTHAKRTETAHAAVEQKQQPLSSYKSVEEVDAAIASVRAGIFRKFGARGLETADTNCQRDFSEILCALKDIERKLAILKALNTSFESCYQEVPAEPGEAANPDYEKHGTLDLECFFGSGPDLGHSGTDLQQRKTEPGLGTVLQSLPVGDMQLNCHRNILICYRENDRKGIMQMQAENDAPRHVKK